MATIASDIFGIRQHDRLADIRRLGLDQRIPHPYLQDLVETAASWLETPFSVIDVLLPDAQLFLAGYGPIPPWIAEAGGTPIEVALCRPLVLTRAARTVPDLALDPQFAGNPLVSVEGLRAYAGAPLISQRGQVLGGLCCLDVRPRHFADDDLSFLQSLADEAVIRIERVASGR